MEKHNGLYFSSDTCSSRQHILATCPRILSGFETCFGLVNAGYGNGLTNAYAGTVLLLADNPWLVYRRIPLDLLETVLHSETGWSVVFYYPIFGKIQKELLISETVSHTVIKHIFYEHNNYFKNLKLCLKSCIISNTGKTTLLVQHFFVLGTLFPREILISFRTLKSLKLVDKSTVSPPANAACNFVPSAQRFLSQIGSLAVTNTYKRYDV